MYGCSCFIRQGRGEEKNLNVRFRDGRTAIEPFFKENYSLGRINHAFLSLSSAAAAARIVNSSTRNILAIYKKDVNRTCNLPLSTILFVITFRKCVSKLNETEKERCKS